MIDVVVDSSAIVAILRAEPEMEALLGAIDAAGNRAISAFNLLETSVVLRRLWGDAADPMLDRFVREAQIAIVPLDEGILSLAREVWGRFGRSRHPAQLNLGDCCAYATAKALDRPLLCKGEDFPRTDIGLVDW